MLGDLLLERARQAAVDRGDKLAVVDRLAGCPVPASALEPLVLGGRVADYESSYLDELTSAGEPLNPEVIEQVKAAWGITIRDGFGQTEISNVFQTPWQAPRPAGSSGVLVDQFFEVRLIGSVQ